MGIRIIIASTSGEKAKYKERILDWIIAFCLLFFMHYIMAASVTVVEKINTMLGKATGVNDGIDIPSEYGTVEYVGVKGSAPIGGGDYDTGGWSATYDGMTDDEAISNAKSRIKGNIISEDSSFTNVSQDSDIWAHITTIISRYQVVYDNGTLTISKTTELDTNDGSERRTYYVSFSPKSGNSGGESVGSSDIMLVSDDSSKVLYFINYARLFLNVKDDNEYIPMSVGYLIIYIALVVFTVVFTIRYIKRVIYMAFLTMIAPMVAMTYPLDKLKDRKSTGMEYVV